MFYRALAPNLAPSQNGVGPELGRVRASTIHPLEQINYIALVIVAELGYPEIVHRGVL
jgi:hypothetical protein